MDQLLSYITFPIFVALFFYFSNKHRKKFGITRRSHNVDSSGFPSNGSNPMSNPSSLFDHRSAAFSDSSMNSFPAPSISHSFDSSRSMFDHNNSNWTTDASQSFRSGNIFHND